QRGSDNEDGGSSIYSSSESDISTDELTDSESGRHHFADLDTCPTGCEQSLFDRTCLLREQKLDVEDAIAEEKRNRDLLYEELAELQRINKVLEEEVKTAKTNLEMFQSEKQKKLNEINTVVTLTMKQIETVNYGVMSLDMQNALVFDKNVLRKMKQRISELKEEKNDLKRQQGEAKKKYSKLVKDQKHVQLKIEEAKKECDRMMVDKFGKIIDLNILEKITINQPLEQVK
ncbi:hypothetical protein HELRODRAFT_150614, partial [Helobdella robusta]|uniref:Uncharacterized protein n=1 Tax=Helobdella robusta TaxID=6412 RepID=T1EKG3_HELRO